MLSSEAPTDPAKEAATYLTGVFERIGVPCRVVVTNEKGKHVVATSDIPPKTDLFEEGPLVSWPAQSYLRLNIPFCTHCLRQRSAMDVLAGDQRKTDEKQKEGNEIEWSSCSACGSHFCSFHCRTVGDGVHRILCDALADLRAGDVCPTEGGNSCAHDDSSHAKSITQESLARCVAWMTARIAASIKHQNFNHVILEKEHHSGKTDSISRQIFHLCIAPFNRLIDTPGDSEFADVDAVAWYGNVARLLRKPCYKALAEAAGAAPDCTESWATEIVEALLRPHTLETLLGQLSLNSQALNGLVLRSSVVGQCDDAAKIPPVACVIKGGGVYTLQSAFNHSCQPNLCVCAVDGTHEISLRTTRPVKNGEELTITYIPLENTTVEERREKLRGYFFTCHCTRCEMEEKSIKKETELQLSNES